MQEKYEIIVLLHTLKMTISIMAMLIWNINWGFGSDLP